MSGKKILLLGAGLVSRPLVNYLLNVPEFSLTIATRTVSKAEKLIAGHERGEARALNIKDETALEDAVAKHDLTISLLPAPMHPTVAKYCLKHKKHLVTTSYVSAAMKAFDADAKAAGLTFLNELGLDPGIDHMSAMRVIHHVENQGGKVVSFRSYCGGLPAPEANDNPFGYKFSWAPRGVLTAATNAARFLWDGKLVEIPGEKLFNDYHFLTVDGMEFEAYPNRDSLPYQELYGLKDVHTMYRGTLRYKGWCDTLKAIGTLGYLDQTERSVTAKTYRELMAQIVGASNGDLKQKVAEKVNLPVDHFVISNLEWLGLFSDDALPDNVNTYLDFLVHKCLEKLQYKPGERDMIVLHHIFGAELNGNTQTITSTLVDYGIPNGDTSMARTVSLPAAIGTKLILEGKITLTGVLIPVDPGIYNPVLDELARLNIRCEEKFPTA